jgi:hypothetical protein
MKGEWWQDVTVDGRRLGVKSPIWRPDAGVPKPRIELTLTTDSSGSLTQVALLDPQQLWFYILTAHGPDPALWPPVPGLDAVGESASSGGAASA